MSLQKFIVRTLLKLPDGVLVKMSGGKPLAIDGRILDARAQLLAVQGARQPSITTLDPVTARSATKEGRRSCSRAVAASMCSASGEPRGGAGCSRSSPTSCTASVGGVGA